MKTTKLLLNATAWIGTATLISYVDPAAYVLLVGSALFLGFGVVVGAAAFGLLDAHPCNDDE